MSEPDLAPVVQHLKTRLLNRYESLSRARDDVSVYRLQGAVAELEALLGELAAPSRQRS
jgi:hypothetical protein